MNSTPPGWFPDQNDPDQELFWDGTRWTGERRPAPTVPPTPYATSLTATPSTDAQLLKTDLDGRSEDASISPDTARTASSLVPFLRSSRARWVAGALALIVLLAVAVPATVNVVQTQNAEQAAERAEEREAKVQAARLALDARNDALVAREETLTEAREFLLTDLGYAPGNTIAELAKSIKSLEDVSLTDAGKINAAVQGVKNGIVNVGQPYTWSISCTDAAYNSYDFVSFRAVWASDAPLKRCEAGSKTGTFYTLEQRAALSSGAISSLESNGILQNICAELGFGTYGSMESYSASQAKEIAAALTICPDHANAAEVRNRVDAALAEETALATGTAFGPGVKRVGQDIQPGTYVTEGTLDGCYWERTDSVGEIIDNNFISDALRAEVTVRAGDYSFSSTRCGTWKKQ